MIGPNVSRLREIAVLVAGLIVVVTGARGMVIGADRIALSSGIDEILIGITLVALGTSLPLVVAGIGSARRGEGEVVVSSVMILPGGIGGSVGCVSCLRRSGDLRGL